MSKWTIYWLFLVAIFGLYSVVLWYNYEQPWFNAFMQIGCILISLLGMALVMFHTFSEAGKGAESQIAIYKEQGLKQIDAIADSTTKQIDNLQELNNKQINALQESTAKQIENINNATQSQIKVNQEESKKQIDAFIQQTEEIIDRLEEVSGQLLKMSTQNEELLKTEKELMVLEEQKWRKRLQELNEKHAEKINVIERLKPNIFFRLETDSYLLFFTHLYFLVHNGGGKAKSIELSITFIDSINIRKKGFRNVIDNLENLKQYKIDLGSAGSFNKYDKIELLINLRDSQDRQYLGHWQYDKFLNNWYDVILEEKSIFYTKHLPSPGTLYIN